MKRFNFIDTVSMALLHAETVVYQRLMLLLSVQYFQNWGEIELAIGVAKSFGLPVAASMCMGRMGSLDGFTLGQCAVRMAKAGADVGEAQAVNTADECFCSVQQMLLQQTKTCFIVLFIKFCIKSLT